MLAINYSEGKVNQLDVSKPKGEGILVNISTCGICKKCKVYGQHSQGRY